MKTSLRSRRLAGVCVALCSILLALQAVRAADSGGPAVDRLARDVERAESIRAVKNLQYAYSHYAQFGLWTDLGSLFADGGDWMWGEQIVRGPAAISKH